MKKTPLKKVSDKRKKQLLLENELKKKLFKKQNGICACGCGKKLETDYFGWDKHEIISRAQGGDPLDEKNCVVIRRQCHMKITEHRG